MKKKALHLLLLCALLGVSQTEAVLCPSGAATARAAGTVSNTSQSTIKPSCQTHLDRSHGHSSARCRRQHLRDEKRGIRSRSVSTSTLQTRLFGGSYA